MKWLKRILIVSAVLLVIALALPFFISFDDYIPRIEKEISARIREPVSIKSIRFSALPLPHVTIDGIAVGAGDDIKLGKVRVTPELLSLLQTTPVIKTIEIDTLTLTLKAIDEILAWSRSDAARSPQALPVRIASIRVSNALMILGKGKFGPFGARMVAGGNGATPEASIASHDGKFNATIRSGQSGYLIDASAKSWTLPGSPALVLDELTVKGVATLDHADLSQLSAKLYGGTANGKATVSWKKGLRLNGELDVKQVEMQKIASMLTSRTHVGGTLNAKPTLSASADHVEQIFEALRMEGPFSVQNGVIHGVDIQKAATGFAKQPTTGGETRFDQLSGHLVMDHGHYRFTQLRIASGSFAVDGDVNISPNKELSGRISAQVKIAGASASVPLNVSGTVDEPVLHPTAGTIAGAAVGTAIMGPGLGTAVGAKVGGWAEGIFGKKEEAKPKK